MNSNNTIHTEQSTSSGPWSQALEQLREWDPAGVDQALAMTTNPWTSGVLSLKTVELLCVALISVCTKINESGTRRHIRAALEAGASRDEILCVLKVVAFTPLHSCNVSAAILLEESTTVMLDEAFADQNKRLSTPTPSSDKAKATGLWNPAWDTSSFFAPHWTDSVMASFLDIYSCGILPPKIIDFVTIALSASVSHMNERGTRRAIKAAFRHQTTIAEIYEVLKICVLQGVETYNLGVPILAEELARRSLSEG